MSKGEFRHSILGIIWGGMSASGFGRFWRNGSHAGVMLGSFGIVFALCLPLASPWWYLLAQTWVLSPGGCYPPPSWTRGFFEATLPIVAPYIFWLFFWYAAHWIALRRRMASRRDRTSLLCHAASVFPIQYLLIWPIPWFTWAALLFLDAYGLMPVERTHPHHATVFYALRNVTTLLCWVCAIALSWIALRNNLRRLKHMLECSDKAGTSDAQAKIEKRAEAPATERE